MQYIWKKNKLLSFIAESIDSIVGDKDYIFSDLFAGTWMVGKFFKERWHQVIANDLQYYSYILNQNYIGNHTNLWFSSLFWVIPDLKSAATSTYGQIVLNYLNNLPGEKWFIYHNYSLWGTKGQLFERLYFSDENAQKCDAIRSKIQSRYDAKKINDNEYFFLLASLLESVDKVANTASVYGAFLKRLKKSAELKMVIQPAEFSINHHDHIVYNEDTNDIVKYTEHDVVYLDPPYNERQYGANYHVLETIARYDNPSIKGKTWIRNYENQKSRYCSKAHVKNEFSDLIQNLKAKYIFLSYNDEGLMTHGEIKEIMSKKGVYWFFTKEYQRFQADKWENRKIKQGKVTEYLHYVIVE